MNVKCGLFIISHSSFEEKQYYLKAISSPLGQRVRAFYTQSSKQVQDIHEEARRIADHEKNEKSSAATSGNGKQTTQGTSAEPQAASSESKTQSAPIN